MKSIQPVRALVALSSLIGLSALFPACGSSSSGDYFPDGGSSHPKKDSGPGGPTGDDDTDGAPTFNQDGGKIGPGTDLDSGCATATAQASRAPVYMEMIADGSGSMNQESKWTALVSALDQIFDDMQTKNDTSFGAGLIVFSDKKDTSCGGFFSGGACTGPYPTTPDVPIAFVDAAQHDKLRGRVDTTQPKDGTPTHAALKGGWGVLEGFSPAAPLEAGGKKVAVIITDGVPTDDCASGGFLQSPTNCFNDATTELGKGISTFVVGVGPFPGTNPNDYDPSFLGQLAKAGGAARAGCNPTENTDTTKLCYFQVTPGGNASQLATQFIDAINAIRGQVASCEFTLSKSSSGQIDPNKVNVVYTDGNGVDHTFYQDATNGWTYDDPTHPTKVVLHGSDCDQVKGDPKGKISIVLGCATEGPH